MKIAIDMTSTKLMSGTRTYNINFCEHLIKKKINQKILIFICKNYKKNLKTFNNKNIRYIVKSDLLSITWIRIIWMQFLLPFELKSLNITKIYSPMNFAPILSKIFGIKIVLAIHSNLPWVNFSKMPGNFFRKIFLKFLMEKSIYACDDLIVNSKFAKMELYKSLDLRKKRIHVIYLGIDKRYKKSVKNRNFIKGFNYKNYILSILSCARYHNIIDLIKAFELFKKRNQNNLKFLFVIQILDRGYFFEIKEYINDKNLKNEILIFHNLETKYLVNLYKYSKLYLFSSYNEVFGLTSLEAMSQGCPVMVSKRSALKEVNGKAAEYFDPDNVQEITNKIEKILFQKKIKNKLKKESEKHIKKFDWNITVNKTIQVLLN